ncbi:MAG: NAD(P)H-hydrate dehydratase [Pseudanabaenaceae cyanobacterium bins.68]|nr:NAD(P)H-hydrate dehydratase [Pseudanabaenaceae cyanobacterium bins.68]
MSAMQPVVTAAQMKQVEESMFVAGLPVSALMEKVALRLVERFEQLFPRGGRVGVLVGSGHNGGDALVMARELWHRGWQVQIHLLPTDTIKPLTHTHLQYAKYLGMPLADLASLKNCDLLIDGWFGMGLAKELSEGVINAIATVNAMNLPVVSIDLPSGLDTDRGVPWGAAIRAQHTFCVGLWKPACFLDQARIYVGQPQLIEFDIPQIALEQGLGDRPHLWCLQPHQILQTLPLERPPTVHKYQVGSLLLVVGSRTYGGAAILAGLGAKATGVGMLTIAVPESIRGLVLSQIPDAIVLGCPETDTGAIAQLPQIDLNKYQAIACGCGWTRDAQVLEQLLASDRPMVIDADGLNLLAGLAQEMLKSRQQTILTPHTGEFSRLFPDLDLQRDCLHSIQIAARRSGAVILLKGAHTLISSVQQGLAQVWINPVSTPALARGGSGDLLTGMIGGLLTQGMSTEKAAIAATVWQAQAGIWLAQQRTVMGVDPLSLAQNLNLFLGTGLQKALGNK